MNHICTITGASSGIGKACAVSMARRGCSLVLSGRNLTRLEETASKCREFGVAVDIVGGSISDPQVAIELFDKTKGFFDSHDFQPGLGMENLTHQQFAFGEQKETVSPDLSAIFAAGIAATGETLVLPDSIWDETISTNLSGLFFSCREAIRFMLERGGGKIVNVLSISSKTPFPKGAAYVASKFGGLGLSHSLAQEFRSKGIQITAFMPGSVDTPLWDQMEWTPERADMLTADDVAAAIENVIFSGSHGVYDEVVYMPKKGFL